MGWEELWRESILVYNRAGKALSPGGTPESGVIASSGWKPATLPKTAGTCLPVQTKHRGCNELNNLPGHSGIGFAKKVLPYLKARLTFFSLFCIL
jgi:hypothetical protein